MNFGSQPPLVDLYNNCSQKPMTMMKNGYSTVFCPPSHENFLSHQFHPNPPNFPPPEPPVLILAEEDTQLLMQQSGNDSGYSDSSSFRSQGPRPQAHQRHRQRRISSPDAGEEDPEAYMCPDSVYNHVRESKNAVIFGTPIRAGSDRAAAPHLVKDSAAEFGEMMTPSLPNLKLTLPRNLLKIPTVDPKTTQQRSFPDLLPLIGGGTGGGGTGGTGGYQPLYASQNSVTLVHGDGTMRSAAAYPRIWRKV